MLLKWWAGWQGWGFVSALQSLWFLRSIDHSYFCLRSVVSIYQSAHEKSKFTNQTTERAAEAAAENQALIGPVLGLLIFCLIVLLAVLGENRDQI